jgi:hypothetical protein
VTESGDAQAHLALSPASLTSISREFVTDRLALYDYALKAQTAAWTHVGAATLGADRAAALQTTGRTA